jgi:hypothetical protein
MSLDAPVRSASGELVPASTLYVAELLAGATPVSLLALTGTEGFLSPGEFGGLESVRVVPGMEPGSHPWFQIRCWRALGWDPWGNPPLLEIGESDVFQLDPTGPGLGETADDAPALIGLASFQLRLAVTLSLSLEAENVVVRWEYDPRLALYLERATSLDDSWQVLSDAVSPHVESVGSGLPAFFRVVAPGAGLQANPSQARASQCRASVSVPIKRQRPGMAAPGVIERPLPCWQGLIFLPRESGRHQERDGEYAAAASRSAGSLSGAFAAPKRPEDLRGDPEED